LGIGGVLENPSGHRIGEIARLTGVPVCTVVHELNTRPRRTLGWDIPTCQLDQTSPHKLLALDRFRPKEGGSLRRR
jgi:hypothetical protein